MKMFEGLQTPVIFLQNVVVDLLLGLGFKDAFRIFADHVADALRRRAGLHHDEPAGAARRARRGRHREPDRLLEHQQDRLPHVRRHRGLRAGAARAPRSGAIAMSVFASGAIPPREAIEWVCAQPNIESIVFGASSRAQHPRARASSVAEHWGSPLTTLLVASTGGHLKQLHRLHRRLDGVEGPYRWVTFDTPQSRSLLAGEDGRLRPLRRRARPASTSPATSPTRAAILRGAGSTRSSAPARRSRCRSSRSRRARGLRCHFIESAARSDGPVD